MSDQGDAILQEILQNEMEERVTAATKGPTVGSPFPDEDEGEKKPDIGSHSQWAISSNGRFTPVGTTVGKLEAGIYTPFAVPGMWGVERMNIESDGLYELPDMATEVVLNEVKTFWNSEEKYRKHKLLYKRGLILWGPPGSGKTVTIKILMQELVRRDGIVIVVQNVGLAIEVLKALRRIEPDRNIITVFEDIDEIINNNGESVVLSMLDGENNIDRVLNLASTNYPERLGARIINRPSRFDRRVYVGMPSDVARRAYISKATSGELPEEQLTTWVKDTSDMSIAHLRELVAAVYCLGQPYESVVERLQKMAEQVKIEDEFKKKAVGFKSSQKASFGID